MFALHDRTRRLICRTAFFAVCVLPALAVWAESSVLSSPSHKQTCEASLSQATGLRVAVDGVSYPRPGITLYTGLDLADPETGVRLARCRFLEAGGSDELTALVASQPELDAARLGPLWDIVHRRLREAGTSRQLLRLSAAEATLHWPSGSQTLAECLAQLDLPGSPTEPRVAALSFRLAGSSAGEPIRIRVARKLSDGQPLTAIELHTGDATLPVELITAALGLANHLGSRATFHGSVWLNETPAGFNGELSGQLADVDLQSLITEQFPHRLSGLAAITIQRTRFHRGRIEEAAGSLTAGPGVVSHSLIDAAALHLHLVRGTVPASDGSLVPYEQLGLAFVIDSSGLTLRGQCDAASGAILQTHEGVLLSESAGPSGPVVALLRTLVPQSEVQVPATREADWLSAWLPLPQVMPPADQPPQGRLRLGPRP